MPLAQCPVCGRGFHIATTGSIQEWYETHYPDLRVGDSIVERCENCAVDLDKGQRVRVRAVPENAPTKVMKGDTGHVVEILADEDGQTAYEVEFLARSGRDKWVATFLRDELERIADRQR